MLTLCQQTRRMEAFQQVILILASFWCWSLLQQHNPSLCCARLYFSQAACIQMGLIFVWALACLAAASQIFQTSHPRPWIARFCRFNQSVCRGFIGLVEGSKIVKLCQYLGSWLCIAKHGAFRNIAVDFPMPVWNRLSLIDPSRIISTSNRIGDRFHWGRIRLKASFTIRNNSRIGWHAKSKNTIKRTL